MTTASGNPAPNQIRIFAGTCQFFQSHATVICRWDKRRGEVVMSSDLRHTSRTTMAYLSFFLKMSPVAIRKAIKDGRFKVCDGTLGVEV